MILTVVNGCIPKISFHLSKYIWPIIGLKIGMYTACDRVHSSHTWTGTDSDENYKDHHVIYTFFCTPSSVSKS